MTIYFDNSATTFPKPEEVYQMMDYAARNFSVNAGRSSYKLAQKAEEIIFETRTLLANLTNFQNPENVILMPSATIALNTILNGQDWEIGDNVYYTPFEHNSVLRPLQYLSEKFHLNLHQIPVDEQEQYYKVNELEEEFSKAKPKLVVINHVSNVIGLIAPIKEITSLAHKYGAKVLVDGAQALGAVPIDLNDIKCDYYVFAGHKNLFGPFGIGGVYINTNDPVPPFIIGGTGSQSNLLTMPEDYPEHLEAGSPNIIAIAGLNAGIKWLNQQSNIFEKKQELFNQLFDTLIQFDNIIVYNKPNSKNQFMPIIACNFEGYTPQEVAIALDQNHNIAVRAGLHCAPLAHKFLNLPQGTLRFSLSIINNIDQLNNANKTFTTMCQ